MTLSDQEKEAIQLQLIGDSHWNYIATRQTLSQYPKAEIAELLWSISKNNTPLIRTRMMSSLLEFEMSLAAKIATAILHDHDSTFHADALYVLWKANATSDSDFISNMIAHHHDSYTRMSGAVYLSTCGSSRHIPDLEKLLNDQETDEEGRKVCDIAEAAINAIREREANL